MANQEKLDLKDKKILYLLNEDARLTPKAVGSQIGASREVVDYRMKRLITSKIIKDHIVIVNNKLLGYDSFLMLIELQNYTEQNEKDIIEKLMNHGMTKWIIKCSGDWDLQVAISAKDKTQLAQVVDEINDICESCLRKYDLTINVNFIKIENLSFIVGDPNFKPKGKQKLPPKEEVSVDAKDKLILKSLATDARKTIVNLAKDVSLSVDATKSRLKNLVKNNVIFKFQTVIDLAKLNYLNYYLFLKFNSFSTKKEQQVRSFFDSLPNIAFVERTIGNWDLRLQMCCTNMEEFEATLAKIREFFAEELKYYNSCMMIREYKRVAYTKGMD